MPSKADIEIRKAPPDLLAAMWPLAQPWILKGLTAATDTSLSGVISGLRSGTDQLWVVIADDGVIGAFLTSFYEGEDDASAQFLGVYGLGGDRITEWIGALGTTMKEFAAHRGGCKVKFCGRPAYQRLLPDYIVAGKHGEHFIYEGALS